MWDVSKYPFVMSLLIVVFLMIVIWWAVLTFMLIFILMTFKIHLTFWYSMLKQRQSRFFIYDTRQVSFNLAYICRRYATRGYFSRLVWLITFILLFFSSCVIKLGSCFRFSCTSCFWGYWNNCIGHCFIFSVYRL